MSKSGIQVNLFRKVKDMYANVRSCVRSCTSYPDLCSDAVRLRQGVVMSPILCYIHLLKTPNFAFNITLTYGWINWYCVDFTFICWWHGYVRQVIWWSSINWTVHFCRLTQTKKGFYRGGFNLKKNGNILVNILKSLLTLTFETQY